MPIPAYLIPLEEPVTLSLKNAIFSHKAGKSVVWFWTAFGNIIVTFGLGNFIVLKMG